MQLPTWEREDNSNELSLAEWDNGIRQMALASLVGSLKYFFQNLQISHYLCSKYRGCFGIDSG